MLLIGFPNLLDFVIVRENGRVARVEREKRLIAVLLASSFDSNKFSDSVPLTYMKNKLCREFYVKNH